MTEPDEYELGQVGPKCVDHGDRLDFRNGGAMVTKAWAGPQPCDPPEASDRAHGPRCTEAARDWCYQRLEAERDAN